MVVLLALVSFKLSSSSLFSSRLPLLVARLCSRLRSSAASSTLSSSSCFSSALFWCSSSGCSRLIVSPSSWLSMPLRVTVKFVTASSGAASGGMTMPGLRVIRYSRNASL